MRLAVSVLALFALLVPSVPSANGWLRGEGQVFLSFGGEVTEEEARSPSLYADWGHRSDLTFGVMLSRGGQEGQAYLFAKRPLPAPGDWQFAWSAGAGLHFLGPDNAPMVVLSFGAGHPFPLAWLAAEGSVLHSRLGTRAKIDLTGGFDLTDRLTPILQLQFEAAPDAAPVAKALPGIVWRVTPTTRLHATLVEPLTGGDRAVYLGLWSEF